MSNSHRKLPYNFKFKQNILHKVWLSGQFTCILHHLDPNGAANGVLALIISILFSKNNYNYADLDNALPTLQHFPDFYETEKQNHHSINYYIRLLT